MADQTMIPEWVVLLVGRQTLELEDARRRAEEAERRAQEAEQKESEPDP